MNKQGRGYHLTSIEPWSAYFDLETYTVLTHQQIPMLLAKSALSCWMYPIAQTTLSSTPSHPWVPSRAVVWPGKNHKYFKKHKLNIEFQSFFLFNILFQTIHSNIKKLYKFVNNIIYKIFGRKLICIF